MKKLLAVLLLGLSAVSHAGLISRTYNYTAGNAINPNENNTNENTIYNEFNGNITATNILDGTLTNAKIADTQLAVTKFASIVQSTFTWNNTHGAYRRPGLIWVGVTSVDVDSNTGTSNETCIQFPDERRCVTENTSSTDKYRRFIITSTATFNSGTEDSGMLGQYAANSWIAIYAVKSVINSSNFVLAGTTNTLTQGNYATLNTMFGTNGWLYLGTIRYGDQSAATTSILSFSQAGNYVAFTNKATGSAYNAAGIRLATTAGAASLSYSFTGGYSGAVIPVNLASMLRFTACLNPGTSSTVQAFDGTSAAGALLAEQATGGVAGVMPFQDGFASASLSQQVTIKARDGSSNGMDIFLSAYWDNALGVGYNPQI